MDTRYMSFCLTDPVFYDSPRRVTGNVVRGFLDDFTVPDGWRVSAKGPWTVVRPLETVLPAQGWKIHVSATPDNAGDVLRTVWNYCVPRGESFKFLSSRVEVLLGNGKYAERGGSGKFVTIYPADVERLARVLHELDEALHQSEGPYVLSDVRWRDGPLYVRYGGFAERFCTLADGERALAIADPDGRLVPDQRQARFAPPSWVDIPEVLLPSVAARAEPDTAVRFPFENIRPLHFSNGGGVYIVTDTRGGREVVLKEARPHAGLDPSGADAVRRLRREHRFLEKLSGTGVVPELYDYLVCWEHHFIVEEYVEGRSVGRELVERTPLIHPGASEQDVREYTRWALDVLEKISRALGVMHDSGIAFGDLHPHNIMLRPNGEVAFVDLEMASYLADDERPTLGAPGYVSPDGRIGADADLYALACLRLSMFLPLTTLLPLDQAKVEMLADSVVRRFDLPRSYATGVAEVLRDRGPGEPRARSRAASLAAGLDAGEPDWPALRESIRDAVLASATAHRTDRLFPGDIEQFTHTGIGLAYGAAGVLFALDRSGCGRFPEHESWLLDAVRDGRCDDQPGFYDGLHGIAYTLAELGLRDEALSVLDRALAAPAGSLPVNLFSGLAGVGLNLLRFAALTGDATLVARAVEAGDQVAAILDLGHDAGARRPARSGDRSRAGLMYGPSGPALLFVRLFEATGDDRFLDLAATALRRDVARCVAVPDGTMQMDEGWRVVPYVAAGSLGVGLVLREFLCHREDPAFESASALIRRAAEPEFVICSGLFNGRAGLIAFLTAVGGDDAVIDRHVSRLAWHVMSYRENVAFPGDQLMRLSMDLATGAAGVLYALSGALDRNGLSLPFLTPAEQPTEESDGTDDLSRARPPGDGPRRH